MSDTTFQIVRGILRAVTIYDQVSVVGVGGITAGTSITLPASGTYLDSELKVSLNGQTLEVSTDYNYVGSGARTQIQLTFDVQQSDRIRFKKGD